MGAATKLKMTLEEYFALDDSQGERYEYLDGEIFPVVDASPAHNDILVNVSANIFNHINGMLCKVRTSSQKVQAENESSYCLPDIVVICGEIKTIPDHEDIVINPILIIEILSPSTQDYDLGGKYKLYRNIDSLTEYICISSTENSVLKHNKKGENIWVLTEYKKMTDTILFESINLQLSMQAIYNSIILQEKKKTRAAGIGYAIK